MPASSMKPPSTMRMRSCRRLVGTDAASTQTSWPRSAGCTTTRRSQQRKPETDVLIRGELPLEARLISAPARKGARNDAITTLPRKLERGVLTGFKALAEPFAHARPRAEQTHPHGHFTQSQARGHFGGAEPLHVAEH